MQNANRPFVGTSVMIRCSNRVLMGQRKGGSSGDQKWCFPGGHLELNESWEECATRETKEETGVDIENITFITATNDINTTDGKHYITIHLVADLSYGEAQVIEPDKFYQWKWFEWGNLPESLFLPAQNFCKSGIDPFST